MLKKLFTTSVFIAVVWGSAGVYARLDPTQTVPPNRLKRSCMAQR